jgi:hypothetical protein
MALGGGLDVKINDSWAARIIQADYVMTRFGDSSTQNNARLSFGVAYRFK